ncbi:CHAT domain-containing protein [Cryptosporangium sp. NPDC051539]|uniref:CHAT domain-containing protein n=1 Tax=Cryptosporangium sp. NPDC051539 TaxID=3363962 RepID=UPI0037AB81B6
MTASGDGPARTSADELLALALARPNEALTAARAILATDPAPALAAVAHQAAGVVLRDFGTIADAVTELRAAARWARIAGDDDRRTDVLASLGVALVMAGRTRSGLTTLERAVDAATGTLTGRVLIRRVYVLWSLGRYDAALADARRAVGLLAGGDPVWAARAYQHRAAVRLAVGDTVRADRDYARCARLYADARQDLEYASARQERGATAFARGDLPAALAHLDDAERIVTELGVFDAGLYVTKTTVLLAAGLHRDALETAEGALDRIRSHRGSPTQRSELLHCAALAAHAAGKPVAAREHAAEALRLFRRQHRPWWLARTELVFLQAQDHGSDGLLRRARRVCTQLDALDPEQAISAHLLTARTAFGAGRPALGRSHLRAAAAGRPRGLSGQVSACLAQALLASEEGRTRAMLGACARGLRRLDAYLRTLGATELRVLATAQGSELAALALRHAVERGDARQILQWSERWRATALAVPAVRPADGDRDLAALRSLVGRIEEHATPAGTRGALQRERHRLEDAIRKRALLTPGTASSTAGIRLPELLGELGRTTTLLELTELDGQLVAVVVGNHRLRLHRVGPAVEAARSLAHALFALRREGTGRGEHRLDLGVIGARLEADLLGDAVPLLGRDEPLVVIPTGRLHAVPWGLLPSLRTRPTSVMPSAAAWLRSRRAVPPPDGAVVLVGGPRLSTGTAEIEALARLYPRARVLAHGAATAENVRAAIDGARLVHIAAHGTFRADSPLFSALELDDGPLTVYDLERLRHAPHRVVLSSCNSAVGAPAGADELVGVVTSLIALGAAGMVASVVPVDDPATVPFMLSVHRHLRDGATPAQALASGRGEHAGTPSQLVGNAFVAMGS